MKPIKQIHKFFSQNLWYAKSVYTLGGMGLGILITYPFVRDHPMRWGLILLGIAIAGHLYPLLIKEKK